MRKRIAAAAVAAAAMAVGFAGSANAAPSPIRIVDGINIAGSQFTVVQPGQLSAGDCVMSSDRAVLDLSTDSFTWTAQIYTTKTSNRDIWHASWTFVNAAGSAISPTIKIDGPPMSQINHVYSFTRTVSNIPSLSIPFPAWAVIETGAC